MVTKSLVMAVTACLTLGLTACDVNKTQSGDVTVPKYDIDKTQQGSVTLPKYVVKTPEVDVRKEEKTVEVPTVKKEERTVTVPNIDVTPAKDK